MTALDTSESIALEAVRRLALCTVAQGAETDLGAQVFQGRRKVSEDMIPCVALIEAQDTVARERRGTLVSVSQRYIAFAYVPCDPSHPNTAAHAALRDMKRAVFTTAAVPDWNWQRQVLDVEYLGKDIGPRADGQAFVVVALEFAVHFTEDVARP